jgi:cytochrome oxidase Cu insertion factor (SCO1/SenC/PrrC family)
MRRPSTRQRRLVILLLALLTFGIAYYGGNRYSSAPPTRISGVVLNPAMPVPAFQLHDQTGHPFGNAQLGEHWSLLLLAPHSNQDESALRSLIQIHNRLADDPVLQQQTLFIYAAQKPSETLAEMFTSLGKNFVLLGGEATKLDKLFEQLGNPPGEVDNLLLYLVDPDTNIQALYAGELDAAGISQDLHSLIAHRR